MYIHRAMYVQLRVRSQYCMSHVASGLWGWLLSGLFTGVYTQTACLMSSDIAYIWVVCQCYKSSTSMLPEASWKWYSPGAVLHGKNLSLLHWLVSLSYFLTESPLGTWRMKVWKSYGMINFCDQCSYIHLWSAMTSPPSWRHCNASTLILVMPVMIPVAYGSTHFQTWWPALTLLWRLWEVTRAVQ